MRRWRWLAPGFLSILAAPPAEAHGVLEGVGDFYSGLLHPLVVPAELLAVLSLGLLLGTSGRAACRLGLPALAVATIAGLAAVQVVAEGRFTTSLVLAVALLASAIVIAGIRPPPFLAAGVAALGGLALGLDAAPDAGSTRAMLTASAATALGVTVLTTLAAALVLGREQHWQRIGVRIASSWIAAIAILYFAWQMTQAPM